MKRNIQLTIATLLLCVGAAMAQPLPPQNPYDAQPVPVAGTVLLALAGLTTGAALLKRKKHV